MKKAITFTLALVMLLSLCLSAFAAPGGFVDSPTGNPAPSVSESTNESPDCDADIVVTPFTDRTTMTGDAQQAMDDAYNSIAANPDLTENNPALEEIAEEAGVSGSALAVSDLFHVGYDNCEGHGDHGSFTITLDSEALDNFVAIMHWDGQKWVVVEGAYVNENGELVFQTGNFGPYAIVVNTGAGTVDPPKTGDEFPWVYAVAMMASAAGLLVVFFLSKKKKA